MGVEQPDSEGGLLSIAEGFFGGVGWAGRSGSCAGPFSSIAREGQSNKYCSGTVRDVRSPSHSLSESFGAATATCRNHPLVGYLRIIFPAWNGSDSEELLTLRFAAPAGLSVLPPSTYPTGPFQLRNAFRASGIVRPGVRERGQNIAHARPFPSRCRRV